MVIPFAIFMFFTGIATGVSVENYTVHDHTANNAYVVAQNEQAAQAEK